MATTLVQQMPVTTQASLAAPEAYHLHSWRPWMSLYGLRLRPRGSAQLEVSCWASELLTVCWLVGCNAILKKTSCRAGHFGTHSKAVATRDNDNPHEISTCHNIGLLSVCVQAVEFVGQLLSSMAVCMPRGLQLC